MEESKDISKTCSKTTSSFSHPKNRNKANINNNFFILPKCEVYSKCCYEKF